MTFVSTKNIYHSTYIILDVSLTFQVVMNEPITSLFSSQSIEVDNTVTNEEENEDDFMVGFGDLEFNPNENDVPNNVIISSKQFKILNSTINYVLEFMNTSVGKSSVSGVDVEYLLMSQYSRTRTLAEGIEKSIDEKLSTHSFSFGYELTKIQDATREHHSIEVND